MALFARIVAALLVASSGVLAPAVASAEPEPVALQLKWKHQAQFAGYYAAQEQGYYREAGLDVRIVEADGAADPVRAVLDGKGPEYGVGSAELVLLAARGEPVVLLAAIFQHSPLVFLARSSSGIQSVHDLVGRRVAVEPQSADLLAYLEREGVSRSRVRQMPPAFSVEPLVRGEVDAMSAYRTDEPFALHERGEAPVVLDPRTAGIDFYGDTLFTTDRELAEHPGRVAAFREASLRGWRWAMTHEDEVVDLIRARYGERHSREHLRFEAAQTRRLVLPDLVEVGYINPGRIDHIAAVYAETGLLDAAPRDLARHVYNPHPHEDTRRLWLAIAGTVVLLGAALGAVAHYRSLVVRLRAADRSKHALVEELERLARTDQLTGLANRRAAEEHGKHDFARCRRHGHALSVIALDVDHFKRVNDTDGHLVGDQVLRAVASTLTGVARASDVVARVGGEEFLVIANETDAAGALVLAERVREAVAGHVVDTDRGPRQVTVSVGIATLVPGVDDWLDLWRRADVGLYAAKRRGRDRAVAWIEGLDQVLSTTPSDRAAPPTSR